MRKTIMGSVTATPTMGSCLDLAAIARVEVSSETASQPIEAALLEGAALGWKAAVPGIQMVRLVFDNAQTIRAIMLQIDEHEHVRSQEFVLRWQGEGDSHFRDIVRQQFNFSPPGTTQEFESYQVELLQVKVLELIINPDTSGGPSCAGLTKLRLYAGMLS